MSFDGKETSDYEGEPRELYWFMRGSESWLYTSSAQSIEFESRTFTPVPGISRSNIREGGGEASARQLTVELPRDNAVALEFIGVPRVQPMWLYVYKIHDGETDYRVVWQGRVRFAEFKGATGTLTLDNILSSVKKAALRHLYQGQCNHFTFDANCGLSEIDYSDTVTITAIDGTFLSATIAQVSEYYIAGQVKRANGDRRFIVGDTDDGFGGRTIELLTPFEDMSVGEEVTFVGGACRHSFDTCPTQPTYGGYPLVPRKNPFKSFK